MALSGDRLRIVNLPSLSALTLAYPLDIDSPELPDAPAAGLPSARTTRATKVAAVTRRIGAKACGLSTATLAGSTKCCLPTSGCRE